MFEKYRIRRGNGDNTIDVRWTYTIYVDFNRIESGYDYKDDEIVLESDDGEYKQSLNLHKVGEVVDNRWIKVTFTKIKPNKPYTCWLLLTLNPPPEYDESDSFEKTSESERQNFYKEIDDIIYELFNSEANEEKGDHTSKKFNGDEQSDTDIDGDEPETDSQGRYVFVLFRHLPLESQHFNVPNKITEELTNDQLDHSWGGIEEFKLVGKENKAWTTFPEEDGDQEIEKEINEELFLDIDEEIKISDIIKYDDSEN